MKTLLPLVLAVGFLLSLPSMVLARGVRIWSYQEMLDKSDLVVIATPTATNDTKEQIELPGFVGQRVVGVESRFSVSAVLKGDKKLKDFVLHHYRPSAGVVPKGPFFYRLCQAMGGQLLGRHIFTSSSEKLMAASRPSWVRWTPILLSHN